MQDDSCGTSAPNPLNAGLVMFGWFSALSRQIVLHRLEDKPGAFLGSPVAVGQDREAGMEAEAVQWCTQVC